jgi:hypothetical protein
MGYAGVMSTGKIRVVMAAAMVGVATASAQTCEPFSFECYQRPPAQWSVPFVRDNQLTQSWSFFNGDPRWWIASGHVDYVRGDWAGSDGPSSVEIGGRGETGRLYAEYWNMNLRGYLVCGHFDVSVNPDTYLQDAGPHRIFLEVFSGGPIRTFSFEYDARTMQPTRQDMKWVSVPISFRLNDGGNNAFTFYTLDANASGVVIDNLRFDQLVPPDVQAWVTPVCHGGTVVRERSIAVPDGATVVWQVEDGFDQNGYVWRTLEAGESIYDPQWAVEFRVESVDRDRVVLSNVRAVGDADIPHRRWTRCLITTPCGTASEFFDLSAKFSEFNCDGFIDFFDYDAYVQCYEVEACPPGQTADTNGDGFVDFFDYDLFVYAFENGW